MENLTQIVPFITTARLAICGLAAADLEEFAAVVGDARVMATIGDGRPLAREAAAAWIETARQSHGRGEPTIYGVLTRREADLIGFGGFTGAADGGLELVFALAHDRWRQGLGFELAAALVEFGGGSFGKQRLQAAVDPSSVAAVKILQRLGMRLAPPKPGTHGRPESLYVLER